MKRLTIIGDGLVLFPALLPAGPAMAAENNAPGSQPTIDAVPAPPSMTDIHDILPPISVGIDVPWMTTVLLVLVTVAILAVAWWLWKKNKKVRDIETIIPELPPEMTAMRALDDISDVSRLEGKIFYFHLSAILRQYVFGRFAVGAPEMTTEEFLPCIDRLQMDSNLTVKMKRLCRTMDPVKFGGETAVEKQMEADLFFAREFVRKTTPAVDAEHRANGRKPTQVLPQMVS